jgi:hypothetical protein
MMFHLKNPLLVFSNTFFKNALHLSIFRLWSSVSTKFNLFQHCTFLYSLCEAYNINATCVCVCVLHLSSSSLQLWNGLQSHLGSTLIVKRLPPLSKFKQLNTACYSVFIGAFQTHIMFRIYTKSWRLLPWACQNLSSWREDSTRSTLEHLNAPCVGIIVPLITKVLHHKTHLCLTANNNFYWHKSYKISIRPMLCKQAYESKKTSNHQSHNII